MNQNQNEIEVRSVLSDLHIEQREQSDGRTIIGYAAKFESWSEPIMGWFKERIVRDAFTECDMDDVIMCFNHNVDSILARTTSQTLKIETDEKGLRFEFEAPNTSLGNDMLELVRRGDISKCSFKFTVAQDEWYYADKDNKLEYDERTILKIAKLYDVSLVVFPAYKDTEASVRQFEERKAEWLKKRTTKTDNEEPITQNNHSDSEQSVALGQRQDSATDSPIAANTSRTVDSSYRRRVAEQLKLKN